MKSVLSAVAVFALAATGTLAGAGGASAAPDGPGPVGQVSFTPGRYIVTLADPSVATYDGGIPGFAPTQPEEGRQLNPRRSTVQAYSDYLIQKQQDVATAVGVDINYSYTMAINAFAADLTAEQASRLVANRDVATVTPDELKHVTAAVPSTEFLGLSGPDGVWASIGGVGEAGKGIVVGVLDTGIAPENPAFAGGVLGTAAGPDPYLSGPNAISYAKADGGTFVGTCQAGEQFPASSCSTKLIGARYYVDGFGTENLGDASTGTGEFVSPRDGDGHGSHTASTAAGNADTPTEVLGRDFGLISGVAPAARLAAYKVCWSGPDPTVTTDDGCTTSDILAAVNQAVIDGVDVLNYSIGGSAAQTTYSATDDAFLGAAAAGIFVSASAGNAGPGASTLDNASPWITTVAASTIPSYEATVTLGDGQAFAGASISVSDPVTGSLVNSPAVAAAGDAGAQANLCGPNTLDPALVTPNTVIVCERGVFDRVAKSAEVARVGGIGMVLVNAAPGSIDTDAHSVPTVHLDVAYHDAVIGYAATPGATATLAEGNSTSYTPPTPQMAGFSSRGPVLADGSDILKPDISAPGVSILAAGPNQQGGEPTYEFLSGTSMAAPHITGLAALYLGERPTATPAEVKSAMMTTAYNTVDASGDTVTDPFAQGAGHVDPTEFFEPGLLYLNDVFDWAAYLQALGYDFGVEPVDPSDLNLASIAVGTLTAPETVTRTVTSTQAGTFTASISGLAGITAVVEPSTLSFGAAGEEQSFTVTFSRTDATLDQFATGALTWTSGSTVVRSPIAVQPVTIVAPGSVYGTGVTGSVDVTVTPGGNGDIPLTTTGLSAGALLPDPSGTEPEHSGSGVTGDGEQYEVVVPVDTEFARFDLDAVDDTTDLDLVVYLLDGDGNPVAGWQSATGAADERVDLEAPEPGTYLVLVDVFTANPATAWDLVVTSVVAGGAPLALTPPVIPGVQGEPATYSAAWRDLEAFTTYVGLVRYGETGAFTAVQVKTGEAVEPGTPINTSPPTITGAPQVGKKLTAHPGEWDTAGLRFAYQWSRDGVAIPGATERKYTVRSADQGAELTVTVTATKRELPPGTATSEGITILYTSTTSLSLSQRIAFSGQRVTATIKVASAVPPVGTVTLRIDGRTVSLPLTADTNGRLTYQLPKLSRGLHVIRAIYGGSDTIAGSESSPTALFVLF